MEWISVNDSLPETGKRVLTYADNGAMFAAHLDGYWYVDTGEMYYSTPLANITHWMPLPAPPEVRHAKWVSSKQYNGNPECSACFYVTDEKTNYCPHCGAKMDKEE